MNHLNRFFVHLPLRQQRMRRRLGALSSTLMYIAAQQRLLQDAVREAIDSRHPLVLPRVTACSEPGILLGVTFNQHDPSRMELLVTTTADDGDDMLVELLRQALCNDKTHFYGVVTEEVVDSGGRCGFRILVDALPDALSSEYRAYRLADS